MIFHFEIIPIDSHLNFPHDSFCASNQIFKQSENVFFLQNHRTKDVAICIIYTYLFILNRSESLMIQTANIQLKST